MQLQDFGAAIRSAMDAVPDYLDTAAKQAGLKTEALQQQVLGAQIEDAKRKFDRQAQFQNAVSNSDGSPQTVAKLMRSFPEFATQMKDSWQVENDAADLSARTSLGQIYAAGAGGHWDAAAKAARAQFHADQAAGKVDPDEEQVVQALESGDDQQRKAALSLIGGKLYARDPEHFQKTFGGLDPTQKGQVVGRSIGHYDENGQWTVDYRDPDPTQYRTIQTTDENGNPVEQIVQVGGGNGGTPSGGAAPKMTPAVKSVADTLSSSGLPAPVVAGFMGNFHVEGGYDGAQGDGGSASGIAQWHNDRAAQFEKVIGKPVTEATPAEQAKFVAWEMQNPEAAGMTVKQRDAILAAKSPAQAAALIDKFYERSSGRDRNIRMQAATAFAGLGDGAGDAPAEAPGGKVVYSVTGKNSAEGGMDPQAIEFSAQQYLTTGQMPTLGMGKAAAQARKQIIERAATIAGAQGLTGSDFAQQMAHYKAATQALKTLETQAGTVEQNEKTALANGQQFLDRSKELPGQTQYPGLNSVIQFTQRHTPVAGHDTIAAMDAAWNTFVNEYAKVVSGSPTGAGTLSDSARHEAMDTMKGNYSYSQKVAAFNQMRADMANRIAAMHSTIAGKYDELTKNPRKAAEIANQTDLSNLKASGGGMVRIKTAADWQKLKPGTRYIDPTGVQRVKK